jgi:hypothetical protein
MQTKFLEPEQTTAKTEETPSDSSRCVQPWLLMSESNGNVNDMSLRFDCREKITCCFLFRLPLGLWRAINLQVVGLSVNPNANETLMCDLKVLQLRSSLSANDLSPCDMQDPGFYCQVFFDSNSVRGKFAKLLSESKNYCLICRILIEEY